jgi:O-acetylserine/cysteine efflux transporter
VVIGLTLFTGQFLLLFFAYEQGLPPGVASVTQQMQAFFTVILAALFLNDIPTKRQFVGMLVAFCGLVLIAVTVGGDFTALGLVLALAAAFSWAIGNVLVKRAGKVSMLPLMTWLCLVPPIPALLVSNFDEHTPSITTAITNASWLSIVAVVYLAVFATSIAYGVWGYLLARYPTALVTPFALLAPCTGIVSSALSFGETFGPTRYAGMALILAGLAVGGTSGSRSSNGPKESKQLPTSP